MLLRLKRGSKLEGKSETEEKKMKKNEDLWEARYAKIKTKFLKLKKSCPQVKVDTSAILRELKQAGRRRRSTDTYGDVDNNNVNGDEGDEANENQATLSLASSSNNSTKLYKKSLMKGIDKLEIQVTTKNTFTRVKRDAAAKLEKRREEHQKKIKNLRLKTATEFLKFRQMEKECKPPIKSVSPKRGRRSILRNGQESLVGMRILTSKQESLPVGGILTTNPNPIPPPAELGEGEAGAGHRTGWGG